MPMEPFRPDGADPAEILARAIPNDRVHSGYLLTGALPATTAGTVRASSPRLACST